MFHRGERHSNFFVAQSGEIGYNREKRGRRQAMRTLYHGSRVTVEQPEIRIQKFHKDFYWGFYCTE